MNLFGKQPSYHGFQEKWPMISMLKVSAVSLNISFYNSKQIAGLN